MENIKITSGKFRGRTIKSPNSKLTHPMGAREKLALFNMISEYLPGAVVLDAYAGSGALGIEALSRGASYAMFVEKNPRIAGIIRKNLAELGLTGQASVSEWDVKNFLPPRDFDVILVDPPYDNFDVRGVENLAKFLKKTGVLVLSHPGEAPEISGLKLNKTHKYAAARISIYTK
jgi:16S rRNA (guanine(966)-N(2))-methyltransferase RsmD